MRSVFSIVILTATLLAPGGGVWSDERQPLTGFYEPSGIVQLPDGRLIIVEDEMDTPISLLTIDAEVPMPREPVRLDTLTALLTGSEPAFGLNDLEAATLGPDGYVYVITSHSRTEKGNRREMREKLMRFRLRGNRAVDATLVLSLRDQMAGLDKHISRAAKIKDAGHDDQLNIEGMAYDPTGKRLLIGMRGPIIKGQSVVLSLPNLQMVFSDTSTARLDDEPILLDLDRGGIRAMAYDPVLKGFLILSRQEKRGERHKLWFWSGERKQPPRRIRLTGDVDLSKAEGLAPVHIHQRDQIMIVFDTGKQARGRYGEYLLLTYEQLKIDPGP